MEQLPEKCHFYSQLFNPLPVIDADVFQTASPFPNLVIDNVLTADAIAAVHAEFRDFNLTDFHQYKNPIEDKLACNIWRKIPPVCRQVIESLNSEQFIRWVCATTGISNLEMDPFLHGGGLHQHPAGSYLDMHLDYSIHPLSGKERRINTILYVPEEWTSQTDAGALQLWSPRSEPGYESWPKKCEKVIMPIPNRMAIFQTNDISLHGLPTPVPPNHLRQSLASYLVSAPREGATIRAKAEFFPIPSDQYDPFKAYIYSIRPHRRIDLVKDREVFDSVAKFVLKTAW